jgi:hypothetical protein
VPDSVTHARYVKSRPARRGRTRCQPQVDRSIDMHKAMYIQLAPAQLKEGVDEAQLLEASEAFQRDFVSNQKGIIRRILVKAKHGGYADIVFFESKEDADRVAEAEATSAHCAALFQLLQPPDPSLPDMGVLSFEHLRTYE